MVMNTQISEKAATEGNHFPAQKTIPRTITTELSATKQSNTHRLSVVEESIKLQAKSCVPKTSCSSANLSAMASKSVSYKEVAVAPPGTVLKPLMEPPEESNEKEPETRTCSMTNETSMEEINTTSVVDNEKSDETNGIKLSAAAEPFNPGVLSVVHTLNSVSGTSIYDVRASQSMLADPGAPPLGARVPCGPRSPLYYRNTISYRLRQGLLKYQTPMTMPSRSMNPHAPEFVPRKAWQTNPGNRDLIQCNVDSGSKSVPSEKFESSPDAIVNDSAIIKVLYGDEEKTDQVTQSNEHEQSKAIDVNNTKNGDGEGFTVVRKRRRNRQFTNGVTWLYNQQSICASVH
ncbi:hypothetical protein GH714_034046 [Hevea brasiliensis]|uniref:Uncharacterized protein n=1 Tax=Hevea brasiliensis TaxID=3981 RepID=A0A6A6NDX2_HEVBR|nr:hypothetical protein GH714_034046 [Hevea brasiliensis]